MKQALNPLRPTPRHCRNTVPECGPFWLRSVSKAFHISARRTFQKLVENGGGKRTLKNVE
nr:MAG TPA_asm: hypothetical protein [Caudoviricetes sp.]